MMEPKQNLADLRFKGATEDPLEGNYFVAAYPPFSCWNREDVGEFRRVLSTSNNQAPFGLYLHLPFCAKRCPYCYYLSYDDKGDEIDGYLRALVKELKLYAAQPALANRQIGFVYFGGGTPSLLSDTRIRSLISELQAIFPWTHAQEVTFECAPQTVTPSKMAALREAGVTRLSLGVQSLNDEVLQQNGRIHLVHDVERASSVIRQFDFDVINLDLMVGLVGETDKTFFDSLERVMEMSPESVTIYQLEIPLYTPLYRALRDGTLSAPPVNWSVKRERLRRAFDRLEEAGYTVRSAYAAVRDPVRHRFIYQEDQYRGTDLLGIGVASFSYLSGIHQQNLTSLETYLASLPADRLPLHRAYALNDEERLVREFVLQLKLGRVEAERFRRTFNLEITERFAEPLSRCADEGWLVCDDDGVTLTRSGLLRVDHLLTAFYLPEHQVERYS